MVVLLARALPVLLLFWNLLLNLNLLACRGDGTSKGPVLLLEVLFNLGGGGGGDWSILSI